jgi:HPt (histidine-containing phosphotransfer) domain-containing protein
MNQLRSTPLEGSARADAVLDLRAIDRLVETCGDEGEAVVVSLLEIFFEDATRLVDDLHRELGTGDADGLRLGAHTLKSHGMTFGAPFLAHVAQELETTARQGDLVDADRLVDEVGAECDRALRALQGVRQELLEPTPGELAA